MCGEMVHLPTHAWEEQVVAIPCTFLLAPPHTRMGRTGGACPSVDPEATSPHTHGKNLPACLIRKHRAHLPTHAWEEPSLFFFGRFHGPPPHTRVGRTPGVDRPAAFLPTSPHTRGKNFESTFIGMCVSHLPTHAWEEPQAVVVTKTAKHNALGFLKKKGQPYGRVWELCPCSTETKP